MRKATLWILYVSATLLVAAWATITLTVGGDRSTLLIGETTDAHHQIELACETCHTARLFTDSTTDSTTNSTTDSTTDSTTATEALNETCRACHDDELQAARDSHARKLFRGPRMAVYRERLDVLQCTTCHIEHRPEVTRPGAVTVATDFCIACHSEGDQDVRTARPSHAGVEFDTCATAGCHNYHDNRALYEDFLIRHADRPWLAQPPLHKLSERYRTTQPGQQAPIAPLAPKSALTQPALDEWASSGHAVASVGCVECHAPSAASSAVLDDIEAHWIDAPDTAICEDCHEAQADTFVLGKHGMRRHPLIAPRRDPHRRLQAMGLLERLPSVLVAWLRDPPERTRMTVAEARLAMRSDAARALDCGTCHRPHALDVARAAARACATCHDDLHSRAYFDSAHYTLWQAELAGDAPPGSGVSCATCHMAKARRRGKVVTSHNQNALLYPNEKMIRPVCLDCHGIRFAIDALADADLVLRNFQGKPSVHVQSVDWALRRVETVDD